MTVVSLMERLSSYMREKQMLTGVCVSKENGHFFFVRWFVNTGLGNQVIYFSTLILREH